MERRNAVRTQASPWLERIAWNAAALAALAVMLLVLLGSIEWLDGVASPPRPGSRTERARASANGKTVVARTGRPRARAPEAPRFALPFLAGEAEACAPVAKGSG